MYEAAIAELSHLDGPDLLARLVTDLFDGNIALVSSFGAESAVLLHMAASIDRSLRSLRSTPESCLQKRSLVVRK
ncbi:hypothetical protein [Rhizobium sp. 007]|uniref:hypothetical protein n=1 Tax=Rhizobium sp. 007 TaxID=2785056 RepID=UPI001FEE1F85|nr:hypothetical protein [Rhizobium sp. 007]